MEALELLVGNFTLEDLARRSGKSIGEIVTFAMGQPVKTVKTVKSASKQSTDNVVDLKPTSTVETRTPAGREAYDATVLAFLKTHSGEWKSAVEVRQACGGTALQARTALARLLADETIEYEGNARATKYRA